MRIEITYIFHNCFVLHAGTHTLLFDLPAAEHLPAEAREVLSTVLAGQEVVAFFSHSHADHFDPGVADVLAGCADARYVVSDDVVDMFPEALPADPERTLAMEPQQCAEFGGIRIEALESNDLGVAFIIGLNGLNIYHGGDLADWTRPEMSGAQRTFTAQFYAAVLRKLAGRSIDVAFSNADPRLGNRSGAADFVRTVRPGVFVPMHLFGRTGEFPSDLSKMSGVRIFHYARPGDTLTVER